MTKRNLCSILLFVLAVFIIGSFLTKVVTRKSDLAIWNDFYSQPKDSIDIIVMGSSLAEMAVNPYQLGNATDCSVFNFAVSAQTTPARVFFLKEILKTQSPKMIIMESYRYMHAPEMAIDEILYSMSGMKWSWNKVKMMLEIPIRDEYADSRMEIIFPLLAGHNRWADLKEEDFMYSDEAMPSVRRGSTYGNVYIESQPALTVPSEEIGTISEVQQEYLEEIILLCQENDIQLLFFNPPNPEYDENSYKGYNALYEFLQQRNIDYIDCNYDNVMRKWVDTTTDFCDYHHTNTVGQYKATKFLSDYINEEYPDLGTNEIVPEQYEAYMLQKSDQITKCTSTYKYVMLMYNDEVDYHIELLSTPHDEKVKHLLQNTEYNALTTDMQNLFDDSLDYYIKIVAVNKENGSIVDVAYALAGNEDVVIHQEK